MDDAGRELRIRRNVAIQHVDAARHHVVVDVVLAGDTHGDSVHDLTRAPSAVLAHVLKVGGRKHERILVESEVLAERGARGAQNGDGLAVAGQIARVLIRTARDDGRADSDGGVARAIGRGRGGDGEALEVAKRLLGFRVHVVHVRDGDDGADSEGRGSSGPAVGHEVGRGRVGVTGAGRTLVRGVGDGGAAVGRGRAVRDQRVLEHVKPASATDDAFGVLLLDVVRGLEQALDRIRELNPRRRIQEEIAVRGRRQILGQVLTSLLELLVVDLRRDGARVVRHRVDHGQRVGLDAGGKLRHGRLQDFTREVVQVHGQFNGTERGVHAHLSGDRQRNLTVDGVLHLQGRTRAGRVLVGQTDVQRLADLGAGNGESVIVLTVDVPLCSE